MLHKLAWLLAIIILLMMLYATGDLEQLLGVWP